MKVAETAAAGGHLARETEEGEGEENCHCWAHACRLHLLLPLFPGRWGSDQLYFQVIDKSFSHRSRIFQLQESLNFFLRARSKRAAALLCLPSQALPGWSAQLRASRFSHPEAVKMLTPTNVHTGDIHAWTHRSGLQLIFSMLLTGAKSLLWALFSHRLAGGRISQNHCNTKDLPMGAKNRQLRVGCASLSPILCNQKPLCHKIPFIQQWSCILKLVCFYLYHFVERTNLVPQSSGGWKPQNFQPKFIHDPLIPICSCANAVLEFK